MSGQREVERGKLPRCLTWLRNILVSGLSPLRGVLRGEGGVEEDIKFEALGKGVRGHYTSPDPHSNPARTEPTPCDPPPASPPSLA